MKILRAKKDGQVFYAALSGDAVLRMAGEPFGEITYTDEVYGLGEVEILVPCAPSKIVAVGLNYAKHAGEMKEALAGNPVLFLKPPTALVAHGQPIEYPVLSKRVDYEAELAVVIKKKGRNIPAASAADYILGYTALNDVTARDVQKADGQWTRAKSFDTFCPVGPYIDTAYSPAGRRVTSVLNGAVKQDGSTDDMLFGIPALIAFISTCMTLLPGDIIATGTPEGIGPMQRGDTIEIKIDGLETLKNTVV